MSDHLNVVAPFSGAREDWASGAAFLRELADRFERGDILEMVVVYNDRVEKVFESFGHFDDRWRLLGALEYAKNSVHAN